MGISKSKLALTQLAEMMQDYINEGDEDIPLDPNDTSRTILVKDVVLLFNDFLLYLNNGVTPPKTIRVE